MKILIVDDEAPARSRLRRLLEEVGGQEIAGEASNGREAVVRTRELGVDLLLMDIRMPGMDGLDAAAELAAFETPPAVIFTTAYDSHAIEAFERNAVDYLLKPVRRERLAQALDKAEALTRPQMAAVERLREASGEYVEIAMRGGIKRIPLESIAFFRADQKYVLVRHDDGEELSDESLKAFEERFGDWLLRIHRNTLIAINRLEALEKGGGGETYVRLRGMDDRLEVSRRHAAEVRRRLKG
jgi:two-component system response regulator AlgR